MPEKIITESSPLLLQSSASTSKETSPPSNGTISMGLDDSNRDSENQHKNHPTDKNNGNLENNNAHNPQTLLEILSTFSRRTKYVLVLCSLANFLASCAFSLLGPFYPLEAEKKGMSLTVTGLVFSVFQLVVFISSPVIGNYLTKLGVKFVYLSGIFVGGSCIILFGTLNKCPSGASFIIMSLLCRSVEALGCAAFMTSSFAIVATECSQAIGTAYSVIQTAAGTGFMVGPAIGGALYQLGGYGLPFYVMGTLVLLNGIFIYNVLPETENVEEKKHKGSIFNLLRSPLIVFSMFSIIAAQMGIAAYESTFAKHMERFNVSAFVIGLFFVIAPGIYAIVAPLWGYLIDVKSITKQLLFLGHIGYALGYFLTGPTPLFPFLPSELWVISIGLVMIGICYGMIMFPAMKHMLLGAYELKYENNMETNALVSGLLNSVNSLGGFLGPMAGGAFVQEFGFRIGYTVFGCSILFAMVLMGGYFVFRYFCFKNKGKETEASKLLSDDVCGDEETATVFQRSLISDENHHHQKYFNGMKFSRSISESLSILDV